MNVRVGVLLCALFWGLAAGAKDAYPTACVDCHVKEHRLSTSVKAWSKKVDAQLLSRMQPLLPQGVILRGKHPAVPVKNVPASCIKCHTPASTTPAAFSKMMHVIHLTGMKNDFVTKFAGDCMHCHKLNAANGTMNVPSGDER